jgi:hypothetical protein
MKITNLIFRTLVFIVIATNICDAQDHYASSVTIDKRNTYLFETCKAPYYGLQNIKVGKVIFILKRKANYNNSILNNISDRESLIAMPKIIYSSYAVGGWLFKSNQVLYSSLICSDITKIYLQTWDEFISDCVYFFP